MKLWKRDTQRWTVREVEGEPYPGRDSEGDQCYINTHFDSAEKAWVSLHEEAAARLSLASSELAHYKNVLMSKEKEFADAVQSLSVVTKAMPSNLLGEKTC